MVRRNVEIKARIRDPEAVTRAARSVAGDDGAVLRQEDTFYPVPNGRLKLRTGQDGAGELIWYDRPDRREPQESRYVVAAIADPAAARSALEAALGVRGVVRKTRRVFLAGRTRVHVDRVERLGWFLELEVVLHDGEPEDRGRDEAVEWMRRLGIAASDLVEPAYIDLLESGRDAGPEPERGRGGA